jgi:uncharacterized protein YvpB
MEREEKTFEMRKTFLFVLMIFCMACAVPSLAPTAPSHTITITAGSGGRITPGSTALNPGSNKTFTIKPAKGFHLAEVRVNGATVFEDRKGPSVPNDGTNPPLSSDLNLLRSGTSNNYRYFFRNVLQDHSLEAFFEVDTFAITVVKTGEGSGGVESSPGGISCGDNCWGIFPYNTTVTLTATGDADSVFDGWSGACRGNDNPCVITLTKTSVVTAGFARAFELSISIHGHGVVASSREGMTCEQSCSAMVKENTVIKLKARPATDSIFSGWTGCTAGSKTSCTMTMAQSQYASAAFTTKDVPPYNLDVTNLPEHIMLPVPSTIPKRNGAYGHCYLESLVVMMAYLDPTVTMEEVFTFSGLGAVVSYDSYNKGLSSAPPNNWTWPLQTRAMQHYGVNFVLGHSPDISKEGLKGASAQIVHEGSTDALNNLKAVIKTGRPVQVHIDLAYLLPELGLEPGASHFIIITGYDANSVYWTDPEPGYIDIPIDPSEYVNVRIPIANFMQAWEETGKINRGAFTYSGTFWMLFLEETGGSQVNRISVEDILSLHRSLSQNNGAVIEKNLNKTLSGTQWWKLAMAKRLFADYLRNNNFMEAARVYERLSEEYDACSPLSLDEQKTRLDTVIKPLEMEARTLF